MDGAIHRAAGPELVHACRILGGCKTGEAKLTKGYRLKANHIIHTVGPVWHGGHSGEQELLASCYKRSMALASEKACVSVAFPCISTGIYGYPIEQAARVAVTSIRNSLEQSESVREVIFCCFSEADLAVYENILGEAQL